MRAANFSSARSATSARPASYSSSRARRCTGEPNRVVFEGLDQFRADLRRLPEELAIEAGDAVVAAAEQTASRLQSNLPRRSGRLIRGVKTTVERDQKFAARAIVRSTAHHAWWYEHGTGHRRTSKGASRGRMTQAGPNQSLIVLAQAARRVMFSKLLAIIERAGFEVQR